MPESEIALKWDEIKENIKNDLDLTDVSYNTWIAPLKFNKKEDNMITILVPSENAKYVDYINKKYKNFFIVTISEMFNQNYDVSFVLEKDLKNDSVNEEESNIYNININNANLNPRYTFDNFVVGKNNKFAHSAALAVAESPGEAYNPLFIYGGPGLGKTHLMHSVGHFILQQNSDKKVLYVNSETFMNEVIESIRSGDASSMSKLRDKYRTVDVLLLDDVQFIIGKDSTQEEFFHTFNILHDAGKQIILSSDKPPKEMEKLEERYISRFEWGLIVDIQPPDYETRMAILKKNAQLSNLEVKNDVLDYIASNVRSNIRELEGALKKIFAASKMKNEEITVEFTEDILKDIINPEEPKDITPEYIIKTVAEAYDVTSDDILSAKRNSEIVLPRQICMYIIREKKNLSLAETAKILNKKDHTTVIHGIKLIKEEIANNPDIKNKIESIEKKLGV